MECWNALLQRRFLCIGIAIAAAIRDADADDLDASCRKCYGYTCDEWISYNPSKYTCESLERDWSCNCTRCSCGGSVSGVKRHLLDEARYPAAKCLDGSAGGYYVRKGNAKRFLLSFQGGGWCYDQNCESSSREGTLQDCRTRSRGRLGSSLTWPEYYANTYFTGMLSANKDDNPVFHDWTLIYLPYCDGASWSGNATVDGLHFRGLDILEAVLSNLLITLRIDEAEKVVVSGGSAGASAVYYHVDRIAKRLALKHGEVLGLPDAGFFLDMKDKSGIDCWPAQMRSLFDVANGYVGLHGRCLARFAQDPKKCMFPQYYGDLIKTRMFLLNSLYDESELACTLRLDCHMDRSPFCSSNETRLFDALRVAHLKAWAPLALKKGNGVWAPACIIHTMSWNKWTDPKWEVPAGSGNTQAAVVRKWIESKTCSRNSDIYEDTSPWPANSPCAHTGMSEIHA